MDERPDARTCTNEQTTDNKGRDMRPGFDALHLDAARRKFDVVMAWSVDRVPIRAACLGIDLFLHQQGIDTTTPAGKAMFQMMGVFAEFERSMIHERVNAGLTGKPCSISPKFGWSVLGLASSSPVPSATECRW